MDMLTDRAPFDYRYLSGRLLRELAQQDDATRSRWRASGELTAVFGHVNISRPERDNTNLYMLAQRSEKLVSDHTTRDLTQAYSGQYLRTQLPLRFGIFEPHMGWAGGKVAYYLAEVQDDAKRFVVALFGSAANVVGNRDTGGSGYYPSDMRGLYTLLYLVRDPSGPGMDPPDYLWDDGRPYDEVRASAAVTLARRSAKGTPEQLDFLARLFVSVEDLDLGNGTAGKVLVGAPLWVATPKPQPV
ncbi:MAG: hypothetical protein J0I11_01980 [Actinobacteria bacterium]|nr:hypothetical protein [Actinomycetota bacterium]